LIKRLSSVRTHVKTTNIHPMSMPLYNDQAHIAQEFHFIDEHTMQTARLAHFKINSYKLSLIKSSFISSREDLTDIIKATLLNYTDAGRVLANLGFFDADKNN
jgi:hypothetical protein